jgi:hypothetical protein
MLESRQWDRDLLVALNFVAVAIFALVIAQHFLLSRRASSAPVAARSTKKNM